MIYFHQNAIESLDQIQIERLSQGIEDTYSADIFARYIAGPAWEKSVINDDLFDMWIRHENIWLRRAAIMSTIHQNKNFERVLKYAALLINDQDDVIVEALSKVLRAASISNHAKVAEFIENHRSILPQTLLEITYADKGIRDRG